MVQQWESIVFVEVWEGMIDREGWGKICREYCMIGIEVLIFILGVT